MFCKVINKLPNNKKRTLVLCLHKEKKRSTRVLPYHYANCVRTLFVKSAYSAAFIHSQKKLTTPQNNTPATQMKSARRVLQSLRNLGRAFSELLIYIAFTMSR